MTSRPVRVIVGDVSERPSARVPNGDVHEPDAIDNATLLARIEVLRDGVAEAVREAKAAREAAEESRAHVLTLKTATRRIASDHFEIRTGIPSTFRSRAVLVAIAAAISAVTSVAAAALVR